MDQYVSIAFWNVSIVSRSRLNLAPSFSLYPNQTWLLALSRLVSVSRTCNIARIFNDSSEKLSRIAAGELLSFFAPCNNNNNASLEVSSRNNSLRSFDFPALIVRVNPSFHSAFFRAFRRDCLPIRLKLIPFPVLIKIRTCN